MGFLRTIFHGIIAMTIYFLVGMFFYMIWHVILSVFGSAPQHAIDRAFELSKITTAVYFLSLIGGFIYFGMLDHSFYSPSQQLFVQYVVYSIVVLVVGFIPGVIYTIFNSD
jgi:hypothetical protein